MGFVGLTTAAIFAKRGMRVYGVDNDLTKLHMIKRSKLPFFEPGLQPLVRSAMASGMFIPTEDLHKAIKESSIVFICVGTPMKQDGSVDFQYLEQVSINLGKEIESSDRFIVICVKSTVPPGTSEKIVLGNIEKTSGKKCNKDFGIAMTPEFLREGSAVSDSDNPHLIVIGSNNNKTAKIVKDLFVSIYGSKSNILQTNIVSAELIKYANNSFLATKISFINTIANICNNIPGADVDVIAKAIGTDPRIGPQFLAAGPGYGGSCFPKDIAGFIHYCDDIGYDPILLKATDKVNKGQVNIIMDILTKKLGSLEGKAITILGTAFKKNTDDIRESVSIKLIFQLIALGANVKVHDPLALNNTRLALSDKVKYASSLESALKDSECIILMTDWDEYKSIDRHLFQKDTKKCMLLDTRRLLVSADMQGIDYVALGRPIEINDG